jgi:hypothetical protein
VLCKNDKFSDLRWWTVSNSKILRFLRICLFCVGRNINYFVLEFCRTVEYIIVNIFAGIFWNFKMSNFSNFKNGLHGARPPNRFSAQPPAFLVFLLTRYQQRTGSNKTIISMQQVDMSPMLLVPSPGGNLKSEFCHWKSETFMDNDSSNQTRSWHRGKVWCHEKNKVRINDDF